MSTKKLQAMPYDVFTRNQAALPQFKRLCNRTIRATRDGQQLAPRRTKHDVYYRLFEEFGVLLDMQHDLLLEIEASMDSIRHLHEFRKQHLTQHTYEFKPVRNRPPTPAPIHNPDFTWSHGPCTVAFTVILQKHDTTCQVSIRILFLQLQFQRIYNDDCHHERETKMDWSGPIIDLQQQSSPWLCLLIPH